MQRVIEDRLDGRRIGRGRRNGILFPSTHGPAALGGRIRVVVHLRHPSSAVEKRPGTEVTLSGGGFPANTTLNVNLAAVAGVRASDGQPEVLASTKSDGDGNFSVTFAMPSRWPDGSSIASGKLVLLVATAVGGVPDIVGADTGQPCARLVSTGNPRELAQAIGQLLGAPAERHELGRRGRERARHYSSERAWQRYSEIYGLTPARA